MMNGCKKCMGLGAGLFVVFGVLFLLQDLNIWDFWGIQWYTVLFILLGILKMGMCGCSDCMKANKK